MQDMGAQERHLVLKGSSTFRLSPDCGDYLLLVRCTQPWQNPPEFAVAEFWEFRHGDKLLITNREEDYPATPEQMGKGGPPLWRALAGDRLVWVGWRSQSMVRKPTLIALIDCRDQGYVYGEPESPTLESVMSFGTPTPDEMTPEVRNLWSIGYEAAVALGLPRAWQPTE